MAALQIAQMPAYLELKKQVLRCRGGLAAPPPFKSPSKTGKWPRVSLGSVLGCVARGDSLAIPCSSQCTSLQEPSLHTALKTERGQSKYLDHN